MKWFISDTYFGSKDILDRKKRPFSNIEDMDHLMVLNWNQRVGKDDVVYHLGDFMEADEASIKSVMDKLNGIKILIKGDKDLDAEVMRKVGFLDSFESVFMKLSEYDCSMTHEPFPVSLPNVWTLHGHVHSDWKFRPSSRQLCLSVENWNYYPVSEDQIIKYIDRCRNPWC